MKQLLLIVLCVLVPSVARAEQFNVTSINPSPVYINVFNKDDGKPLWHYVTSVQTLESEGNVTLQVTEKCEGIWDNKDERTWVSVSTYSYADNKVVPVHALLTFYDPNGREIDSLEKDYSLADNKVHCKKINKEKTFDITEEDKDFDFDADLVDKEILGVCFMNYPYDRKEDLEFHMMTNEPAHYKMKIVNLGKETLKLDGSSVECYKLQMIPDLGFLGIFAPFVPKTYFWYKAAAPHEFVRYEGLESGLNTPYVVMEVSEQTDQDQ